MTRLGDEKGRIAVEIQGTLTREGGGMGFKSVFVLGDVDSNEYRPHVEISLLILSLSAL